MTEKMTIYDFGPIRKAEIDVRGLTVFVGQQATGKSLAAEILSFMRGLEDLLSPETLLTKHDETEIVVSSLEAWLGSSLSLYVSSQTVLRWIAPDPDRERVYEIKWDRSGPHLSEALRIVVQRRAKALDAARLHGSGVADAWDVPRQVYIPAGRALYSFIPSYSRLYLQQAPRWPGYVSHFYETLGTTLAELDQYQEWEHLAASELGPVDQGAEPDWVRQRIDSIMKGELEYKRDSVALRIGSKRISPTAFAAGQMEIWPFFAMVQAGFEPATRVYFEEPEAHLHPGAQRRVIEIITYLVAHGKEFVVTTHSPYVLYAINNCLMANKLIAGRRLLPDLGDQVLLNPERVSAYRFPAEGAVESIMDRETGLIDESELDQVADDLGATFTQLQEMLEDAE